MQEFMRWFGFAAPVYILLSLLVGAHGRGFRLYPHDQENLLHFLNLCRKDLIPSSPNLVRNRLSNILKDMCIDGENKSNVDRRTYL